MSHRIGLHSDDSPYEGEELCYCDESTPPNTDNTELRKQICKIFNVFPEELQYNLPGGIGLKKVKELEALIKQQDITSRIDELVEFVGTEEYGEIDFGEIQDRIKELRSLL